MNPGWVETWLGLIFHIYGLAFFVLGIAALLTLRRDSRAGLAEHLGWLAAFGIFHGLQEFVDGERLHNPSYWLVLLSTTLMVSSFAALLEFGRRLWNERADARRLNALPLYSVSIAAMLALIVVVSEPIAGLELGARYLLGAPGATLVAIGLLNHASVIALGPDTESFVRWLRLAAYAMLTYAMLTLFPSLASGLTLATWWPTTADFLAVTELPIQLVRTLCAILLTLSFIAINRLSGNLLTNTLKRVTNNLEGFVYRCRNDPDWTVTFMSEGGETLTGYPASEFLRGNRHFADQMHPDDRPRVWDQVQAALEVRRSFRLLYRLIDRDGQVKWCHEDGRGVFNDQGELLYLEGLVRDDEARHRAANTQLQMQALVEASPQSMGWADPDGTARYFNPALRTLLSVPEDVDIADYRLRDFYDDKAFEQVETRILPAVAAKGEWTGEIELMALDGRRLPTLHSVFALNDEAGEVSSFANVITDLSDIRAEEREMRIKDTAIASSISAIGLAGLDGTLTYVNPAFVEFWGLSCSEEALGRSVLSFWAEPDQAQAVVHTLASTGQWQGELAGVRKDGSVFDTQLAANMVFDHYGQPLCMMASFMDVTARNQSLKALQQERDFVTSLLDTAPVIILLMDLQGIILHVNPWFEQLTGYRLDEVVGKEWFATFLPARDQARIRELFASALHDQPVRGYINPIVTRDGAECSIEWHAAPVRAVDGKMSGLLSIGLDVTKRQQFENELRELNQSLEQRVAERTLELERASAAKSEFLSRMSHELRTPLNAILGFSQILQMPDEQPLNPQQADYLGEIQFAGEHLLTLVNEVLDLARIEAGQLQINPEPLALCSLIEQCVGQVKHSAHERGLKFTLQLHTPCTVLADPTRLKQVLLNLLSNAVKYNREGGGIDVRCESSNGEHVRVSVCDTGRGLSTEQQARLFRPFERLESAYDGIEGAGVGLAIAKRLVEGMQGRIGVDSVPDEGSTFWIELPLSDTAVTADTTSPGGGITLTQTAVETRKVLYVEDNPANLRLVQKILSKLSDIELISATDADEGLALASAELPDLILLDINLPGMNGYQMLQVLKADARLQQTPVIATTANAMPRDVERGKAAGFVDYLTKPLNIKKFTTAINYWLDEQRNVS